MTNQQILEKAIQKAIDGLPANQFGLSWRELLAKKILTTNEIYGLIFNHDFAKALWGEDVHDVHGWGAMDTCQGCGMPDKGHYPNTCWEWHLQQMVIADDPIKYLSEHI